MERTLYLLIFFSLFHPVASHAQSHEEIYEAYVLDEMHRWKAVLDGYAGRSNLSLGDQLEYLEYLYGYIAWCVGNDRDDEASGHLDEAFEIADYLESKSYSLSNIYAYKAAFYGYKIGLAPYKAPFYGPKSKSYAQKAIDTDSKNPLAYTQLANMQFYMPPAFGGSKEEAIKYYQIALAFLETEKKTERNWNYLSLLATMGQAYEKIGNLSKAKSVYVKALETDSRFKWVKNELLPNIEK